MLVLFRESTKEGALTYADWRLEGEEYIMKGYSGPQIKDAMVTSLEDKAKRNYQACDEKGDLMPESQPLSTMVPESTWSCQLLSRSMAWWLALSPTSTNTKVRFQLVVVGVIIPSLSVMSWSGYNFPEFPHMMRTRWLW